MEINITWTLILEMDYMKKINIKNEAIKFLNEEYLKDDGDPRSNYAMTEDLYLEWLIDFGNRINEQNKKETKCKKKI